MNDETLGMIVLTISLSITVLCITLAIRMAVRNARRSRCPNCGSARRERVFERVK